MWLKIKVWTKVALFGVLALYALIFIFFNSDKPVSFWYWPKREPTVPLLILVLVTFVSGIIGTILLSTTFKTLRQIRELQAKNRAERLSREVEAMKMKAATLRTRDDASHAPVISPSDPTL